MAFDDHCKGRFEIAIARGGDHNEFLACSPCSVLHVAQFLRCIRAVRIGDDGNNADIGNKLARKLKPLPTKPRANQGDARHVAFGLVQSRHEAGLDWIEGCNKAANAAAGPDAAIKRTCPLTRSAANAGSRSSWPSAMRASTVTSRPTV